MRLSEVSGTDGAQLRMENILYPPAAVTLFHRPRDLEIKHHGNLKTPDKKTVINYLYSLCVAPDGRKIFYVPSVCQKIMGYA